jgi:hypothetical protein
MCQSNVQGVQAAGLRHLLPDRWWEKAAALYVGTFKPDRGYSDVFSLDPEKAAEQLAELRAQGFQAIEIFAPAEGLYAYAGLDMTDPYRIDPELGTMEDFRRFVRLAHSNGVAVIVFFNLGYFSIEAPAWLEACRDKKAGRDTEKVRWFSWADRPDAPPPARPEDVYFTDMIPPIGDPDTPKTWGWQYSDLAGCYYWSRWEGKDKDGNLVGLPQMDWASPEWPQEAERIIRCWMETGLDGMLVDAPGCYQGLTWETNNRHITSVISSYGNTFILPEGVSEAMLLAPSRNMPWLTEGGYNGLINYGLGISGGTWKESESSVTTAIQTGDPRPIEESLRAYRDLAVAAGGVLYGRLGRQRLEDPQQRMLQVATLGGIGDMLVYRAHGRSGPDDEEQWLLRTRYAHPALHQLAARRQLPTNADSKYYAFLRTAQDGSERVLVVLNFQPSPETIVVDLSRVATAGLIDLKTGEWRDRTLPLRVALPAYGYAFFEVLPALWDPRVPVGQK